MLNYKYKCKNYHKSLMVTEPSYLIVHSENEILPNSTERSLHYVIYLRIVESRRKKIRDAIFSYKKKRNKRQKKTFFNQ